ncbi:MAG: hypothetical protein JWR63_3264, partial [Conexibacter sp.]|nr:hypothetical protein [Conexibacter sp.]
AAGAAALTGGAAGAQAAPTFHCEASPLRATIAGTQTIEPVTQGRSGDCATGQAVPSLSTPLLTASVLTARTDFDAGAAQGAAKGAIANLAVLPTSDLVNQALAPVNQAIDALAPITLANPLPSLPGLPLPTIAGITLDVRGAVRALLPASFPALLSADVLSASANVGCAAGAPSLAGASNVAGVKILGTDVGVDGIVNQVLPLLNGQSISLSQLDLTKVTAVDALTKTPIVGAALLQVLTALKPALAALPAIPLPPSSLLSVRLVPNEQTRDASSLTQRALHASISLVGQPVLDAVFGEAKVSAADGTCAPPAPAPATTPAKTTTPDAGVAGQSVADQLLACSDRKLVLVDVLKQGGHVKLLGAANRDYVGKRVAIRLRATGQVVAHAKVAKDGSFETTAPMPARAYFASHKRANSVRYRAEIGKELSLPLKLQRRLIVSSLTSKAGKVTIAGRVVRPLTTPISTVRVVRRVSCHKVVLVARFKPRSDGTFRITVKAPKGQAAAIYRLATSVREKPSNPRSYPTFTLPRGVALNTR